MGAGRGALQLPLSRKRKKSDVAKYDRLQECLERIKEQTNANGVSNLALPSIGCVDYTLEWTNLAISIDSIFQDSNCTVTVYTAEDQMVRYPETKMSKQMK